jgi:hypothetical protein
MKMICRCQMAREGFCWSTEGEREAEAQAQPVARMMACWAALIKGSVSRSEHARKVNLAVERRGAEDSSAARSGGTRIAPGACACTGPAAKWRELVAR